MNNNISFKADFKIANTVYQKYGFRKTLTKKNEARLVKEFQKATKNKPYTLTLEKTDPVSKFSFFTLKLKDKVLASRHETFLEDPEKMNMTNLLDIFNKLVYKKEYDEKLLELEIDFASTKKYLTELNEFGLLKIFERDFLKKKNELDEEYNAILNNQLIS